jgi:hypothetical protein
VARNNHGNVEDALKQCISAKAIGYETLKKEQNLLAATNA